MSGNKHNAAHKAWRTEYYAREDVKAHRKEYYAREDVKAHRKEYRKEYYAREDVKARRKEYQKNYNAAHKEIHREQAKAYREKKKTLPGYKEHRRELLSKVKYRFHTGKGNAKKRKLEWRLSLAEYAGIVENAVCHYCGNALDKQGCGLDRKDNEAYYAAENVVPCCGRCNTTFMDNFTYREKVLLAECIKDIDVLRFLQHK